jgi:hypothetical protein
MESLNKLKPAEWSIILGGLDFGFHLRMPGERRQLVLQHQEAWAKANEKKLKELKAKYQPSPAPAPVAPPVPAPAPKTAVPATVTNANGQRRLLIKPFVATGAK